MAQIVTITNPLTGQPAQVDQLDHTAQEIDDAIARALPGGAIDITLQKKLDTASGAGAHNSIYRGKYLGASVTAEQYSAIAAGTFDDLYIGDYWTIGGVNYRIAAFDYYYRSGDNKIGRAHV